MKILQLNSVVSYGSTGRIAEEIGLLAISNGWESYIAFGLKERPSQSKLIRIGNEWDVMLHGLQTRLFDRHGLGSKNTTCKFIRQIEQIKPDIIHLHNLHGYFINIEILFKYLEVKNIPIVWTLHDCWTMTGHCAYFDDAGCEKWKTECYNCPQKKLYPASLGYDRSKQNFHLKKKLFTSLKNLTHVPVSNWLGRIVQQSFFKKVPIQVINNGINLDVFQFLPDSSIRDKYQLKDQMIILGVASVWDQRKGLKDFIELSKRLNSNFQIILVGLNEAQIKHLPLNILGITKTESNQELAQFYSIADVFVNPTWEDNFPTTNLEALACGTPVITYNTGGSPESIDNQTGFVVEKGDILGLIQAINNIKEKGKRNYSIYCRERAEKLYDKNDRYMDYIRLYESILNQHAVDTDLKD